ncbi:MAG: tetratricopeptide repeat protein [Planctomycetes bacterium]|nr:tetratricopeptide repeat protein [Planctomycetota bacterium]
MQAETAYLFRHAVLRDAAYQLHMPSSRAALHGIVLDLLPEVLSPSELAEVASEMAEHARSAMGGASPEQAQRLGLLELQYLEKAAEFAGLRFQNADAGSLWGRVLAHPLGSAQRHVDAALALAEIQSRSGHAADAMAAIEQGRKALATWELGPGHRIAEARLEMAAGDALAYTSERVSCVQMLQQAAELFAQAGDVRGQARALCGLGRQHSLQCDRAAAEAVLQRALDLLHQVDDPALVGTVKVTLATTQDEHLPLAQVAALHREALALLPPSHALVRVQAISGVAHALARTGDAAGAQAAYEQALSMTTQIGALQADAMTRSNLAMIHMEAGRYAEAEEHYVRALKSAREAGSDRDEGRILGNLGNLYTAMFRPAQAEELFRQALVVTRRLGSPRAEAFVVGNLAPVLQLSGRLVLADRAFGQCRDLLARAASPVLEGVYAGLHGRLLLLLGRLGEARAAAASALVAVPEGDFPSWRVEFALPLAFCVAVEEIMRNACSTQGALEVLQDMRRVAVLHNMPPEGPAGISLAECERVWSEFEDAKAQGRKPLVFAGVLAAGMSGPQRLAILLRLKSQAPRELASLQADNPELLATLEAGTAELLPPPWDSNEDPDL